MRKIPTLFVRDLSSQPAYVLPQVTPGCEWVLAGEGVATRKYDGTCVMLDEDGEWWARREVKPGKKAPAGFVPVETDDVTGKTVGWEPMSQSAFAKWHAQALNAKSAAEDARLRTGTYELLGPKINGNPERWDRHGLLRHADAAVIGMLREITYDSLRDVFTTLLAPMGVEGVVWHHPDGRMAKLKVRDFPRPTKEQ